MSHSHQESPEQDFAVAQQAFQQGDLHHALHHVNGALASDPTRREWLGLLDAILRRADDALALTAPDDEGKTDFATAASRAYAHAMRGQWDDAFSTIVQAAGTRPDVPYLAWADGWLRQPGVAQQSPDVLMPSLVIPLVKRLPDAPDPKDPRQLNLRWAASILSVVRHYHPRLGFAWYASSVIARRLGGAADAVPLAQQGLAVEPCYLTSIGLACALRDCKRLDEAIQAFHGARQYEPNEAAVFVDIGDIELGRERFAEAAAAYQQALQREPEHAWAIASAAYARFKQTGDGRDRDALINLRDRFPRERRPQELAQEIEPFEPYVTALPVPGDATSKPLVQILEMLEREPEKIQGGKIDMKVSHPESPSVMAAFRLATAHANPPIGVNLTVEKVQSPDPRAPKGQVDFVAWAYDGMVPRPNIGAPDPRIADAVAQIAQAPYGLARYAAAGQALGAQLAAGWIPQLVATMVHPPAIRDQLDPFQWVQRVQLAAALTIAHVEAQTPWQGSARNRALTSLALGPVDWTATAGILALAWVAKQDANVRREVEPMLAWLETQIPKGSFTCFEYPLVCARLWLGGLDAASEQRLRAWLEAIERGEGRDQQEEEERYEGLDLEQYAEFCVERDAIVAKHAQGSGFGAGQAFAAMGGGGAWPELEQLCRRFGVTPKTYIEGIGDVKGPDVARVHGWDHRIRTDGDVQKAFFEASSRARLKKQGIDPNSKEGQVAQRIAQGAPVDLEKEKAAAQQAAQQLAQGQGGDEDPVVFPGQKLAKLSDYVGLMKLMQTGNMQGALAKYGLDMGSYVGAAQAWGVKLAADPVLNAKFAKLMAGR
jgi:tetratricopeptide (TPR) repeat protein